MEGGVALDALLHALPWWRARNAGKEAEVGRRRIWICWNGKSLRIRQQQVLGWGAMRWEQGTYMGFGS